MGKRYTLLTLLVLFITMVISACGLQAGTEENWPAEDGQEERKENIVVGFSQVGSESDWRIANSESFRQAFTEKNGYYLIFEDAQQKQENQLKAVRDFILQEVDYIVLDPIVETGWEGVLQEAREAGIPVILADRLLEVEDEDLYTCWVGSDFEEEGRKAGNWLIQYLEERERTEESINIVTIQGTLDSSAQIGRTKGFQEILEEQNNWNMLEKSSGDFTQAKGKEVMESYLEKYEDIDVVICENDNMAFGAIDAIKKAGRTCGPKGDIVLISFDAVPAALEAMQRGELNVTIECNPYLGSKVSDIIKKLERGDKVEKIYYVEESYFDTSMDLKSILKERTY